MKKIQLLFQQISTLILMATKQQLQVFVGKLFVCLLAKRGTLLLLMLKCWNM